MTNELKCNYNPEGDTCTPPIQQCEVCKRYLCEYHGSTFSHAMTCRTPEEDEKLKRKYGLIK